MKAMATKPTPPLTVAAYLAALPPERKLALNAVRAVIKKNLDPLIEEGIQYGVIGYYIPHSVFPAGYHCDPKQPLSFAGLASQKGHMSLYMSCLYIDTGEMAWFHKAWAATGKKLDMGKACVRFKTLDALPLGVIGEAFKRLTAKHYITVYEGVLNGAKVARTEKATAGKKAVTTTTKSAVAPSATKVTTKAAKKTAKKTTPKAVGRAKA